MMANENNFGSEIRNIRQEKNFTLRQTALQAKIDPGYLSLLERGKRNIPKPDTLKKLAKGLRISENKIFEMAGLTTQLPDNMKRISNDDLVNVPIIGEIACGEPIIAEQNIDGYLPIPHDNVKDGNYFVLKCRGDSMEPTITNGSNVLIREQPDADDGQIAAVLLDDDTTATLKRIKHIKDSVFLIPDNPKYEPIVLNEDKSGKIIGIVKMEMKMF
ncbi:SOS-response repressor and protease LexA [Fructilactobacillus florum 8D]|uniref:SOS-response repressor and protease LexA n=1 Tax=Fructilactobacillus florum 8D TaxID=1221538 RepID=W9EJZ7_9LACO|nr:XRE family transcriptional regulator [Fructilactobacillus florum]ETO40004.1 SOS-response repressor and protease LexA [Fructilactobacillus florum 8D]